MRKLTQPWSEAKQPLREAKEWLNGICPTGHEQNGLAGRSALAVISFRVFRVFRG
jgi:hypothetical protein